MKGQMNLFEPDYIKDIDCTLETPVKRGIRDRRIYGTGTKIKPRIPGRKDTKHMENIFLEELFPLEEYDLIVVLISGGKDSIATYFKLRELGVPKSKIEFWHHDIDGGNPKRHMDWRCTQNYMKALADAEGIPLRLSWRKEGFFGELYRIGASKPIEWVDPETGEIFHSKETPQQLACKEIEQRNPENKKELLKQYGYRMKFPAKSGNLMTRWCSPYLKIDVAATVLRNLEIVKENSKVLICSGERRGESVGRSKYNEMEIYFRANAEKKLKRTVHQWRPVIDYSEKDVWEVLKRNNVSPHPCYRAGWNRCSCAGCIFSTPELFAGFKEIYPEEFEKMKEDERILGFTLDNKYDLETYILNAKTCLYKGDKAAIHSLITGEFTTDDIFVEDWKYPAGAFHGSEGGPC